MYDDLPRLPVMGVGSYAAPGWLTPFRQAMRSGQAGPDDIAEAYEDATRVALDDQIEAGIDVLSDGELQRQRFVYEMYDRIAGLERHAVGRKLGVPGYDRAPAFTAGERLRAEGGLGLVAEFETLRRLAPGRAIKIAFPGPCTFAGNIHPGPAHGSGPAALEALLDDIVALVRAEVIALAEAGAEMIQLDEPGFAHPPAGLSFAQARDLINRCTEGHTARTAVHVCFGNNASRPYVRRDMTRFAEEMGGLDCRLLLLEFANREMSEIDLLAGLAERFEIAAGVVDVKNWHTETAEEVAERLRRVLAHVPPERLWVTADCGFSAIPRFLARRKMQAMVAGARLLREELAA